MRSLILLIAAVCIVALLTVVAVAAEQSPSNKSSLDAKLLEELGNELLDELDQLPKPTIDDNPDKSESKRPAEDKPSRSTAPIDGEDIGQPGENDDPLRRIAWQMRQVKAKLAADDSSADTQRRQQSIVDDLAAWIESLQSPKQGGQPEAGQVASGKSKPEVSKGPEQPGDSQQPTQPGADPGSRPTRDSTSDLRPDDVAKVDADTIRHSMKQAWGNLPERLREQMLQSSVDDFLPKYELMIEQYFKRLAELPEAQTDQAAPRAQP